MCKNIGFLHKNGVLVEDECERLFGGNWNNKTDFSKDNENIMLLIQS